MIKWPLFVCLLFSAKIGYPQSCRDLLDHNGMNLLEFRDNQVRTLNPDNAYESWLFSYNVNMIEVNYTRRNGEIEHTTKYYLNENDCPDSINYIENYIEMSVLDHTSRHTNTETFDFEYDAHNRLKTIVDKNEKRIWKTVFYYNPKGQLDSLVKFANKTEGIFGTRDLDTLVYQYHEKYTYDELGRLSKSDQGYSGSWIYEYDENSRLIRQASSPFHSRSGCLIQPGEYFRVETFEYNERGLKSKAVSKTYEIKQNGKLKRTSKRKFKYEYEYYTP
jgi:hypothetical protein